MSKICIQPTLLKGSVKIPPSKSIAHRAVIAACLCSGSSHLENIDLSDDILATIEGMRALGATIRISENSLMIQGIQHGKRKTDLSQILIDCKESGSTLRFLIPIALALGGQYRFIGKGNLGKRPLTPYYTIFEKQNISYHKIPDEMDLSVCGKLSADAFSVDGNISSQFITGLLYALPLLENDSAIMITSPLESKSYVDLTLQVLSDFGITIINHGYERFEIKGNQCYQPCRYKIESDFSQAAFFLCAGALGGDVTLKGLNINSLQGDREIIELLKRMGANITYPEKNVKAISGSLIGIDIDASQIPDIIPVLAATACLAKGKTIIRNAHRLRMKECDRLSATIKELSALGANIREENDCMYITGVDSLAGGCEVDSHADHRIAMMLAVITQRCSHPIIINDYECVSKSYPNFFKDYKDLGGIVYEQYMG